MIRLIPLLLLASLLFALLWATRGLVGVWRPHLARDGSLTELELARAWDVAAEVAPGSIDRLDHARARCGRLLAVSDARGLDLELGEWAVFVRRRVPELVEATLAQAATADGPARAGLVDGLVNDLDRIGVEAERRLARAHVEGAGELDALRRHVANRTGSDAPGG